MAATPQEIKQIRGDFGKFLSGKRKAATEVRRKVRNRFVVGFRNGENDADVKAECMDRFGVSSNHYDKIVANRYGDGSPKGDALTDAMIIVEVRKLQVSLERVREWCEDSMCKIDEAEENGEKMYSVEATEQTGGKDDGKTVTKSVPLDEARYLILRREVDANRHFFDMVGKLKGPQTLIQINTGDKFANITASEIQKDIRLRIKDEERHGKVVSKVIDAE